MGTANTCWHLEIWAGVFTFFIRQLSQFPTLFGCSTISKCNFYFSIYLINLINWQMLNRFPLINATNFSWLNNKWINIFCLVISLKPIFFVTYSIHPIQSFHDRNIRPRELLFLTSGPQYWLPWYDVGGPNLLHVVSEANWR